MKDFLQDRNDWGKVRFRIVKRCLKFFLLAELFELLYSRTLLVSGIRIFVILPRVFLNCLRTGLDVYVAVVGCSDSLEKGIVTLFPVHNFLRKSQISVIRFARKPGGN